jgi:hypothetical protein
MKIIALISSPLKSARDPCHERCPACGTLQTEELRVLSDDGQIQSWVQCSRCSWSQASFGVQLEFPLQEDGRRPEANLKRAT